MAQSLHNNAMHRSGLVFRFLNAVFFVHVYSFVQAHSCWSARPVILVVVRKMRWAASGQGKRGGIRVIYYWKVNNDEIWMLTLYGKNEREKIAAHILKQIAEEIKDV